MPRQLTVTLTHPDDYIARMEGKFLNEDHYSRLIVGEDVDVLKPDGTPLLMFRRQVLPAWTCRLAYQSLVRAATPTDNRGTASGSERWREPKADGTLSKVTRAATVLSGVIGYFDRTPRNPYCRTTLFTKRQVEQWHNVLPFIRAVNDVFRRACPGRYAAQMAAIEHTQPAYVITGTAFTTITVNRNFRTAVHKDKGDLPDGFGVMSVIDAGSYTGGYLCFPKYRVAVDMRSRDVLLADVHEFHGNTPIVGVKGEYERISTVMYYRSRMMDCLPPAQEFARS